MEDVFTSFWNESVRSFAAYRSIHNIAHFGGVSKWRSTVLYQPYGMYCSNNSSRAIRKSMYYSSHKFVQQIILFGTNRPVEITSLETLSRICAISTPCLTRLPRLEFQNYFGIYSYTVDTACSTQDVLRPTVYSEFRRKDFLIIRKARQIW